MLGQVAVALHVGEHAQDGDVLATLVGRRLAVDQLVLHRGRDLADQLVDHLVALDQLLGGVPIARQQRVRGTGDALAHQAEGLREQAVDLVGLGHRPRPEWLLGDQRPDLHVREIVGLDRLRNRLRTPTELERHPRNATGSVAG